MESLGTEAQGQASALTMSQLMAQTKGANQAQNRKRLIWLWLGGAKSRLKLENEAGLIGMTAKKREKRWVHGNGDKGV